MRFDKSYRVGFADNRIYKPEYSLTLHELIVIAKDFDEALFKAKKQLKYNSHLRIRSIHECGDCLSDGLTLNLEE